MQVLVTTEYRGVFVGELHINEAPNDVTLRNARMVIAWGTSRGLLELVDTGPTPRTRLSAPAPKMTVWKITGIFEMTATAARAFDAIAAKDGAE